MHSNQRVVAAFQLCDFFIRLSGGTVDGHKTERMQQFMRTHSRMMISGCESQRLFGQGAPKGRVLLVYWDEVPELLAKLFLWVDHRYRYALTASLFKVTRHSEASNVAHLEIITRKMTHQKTPHRSWFQSILEKPGLAASGLEAYRSVRL